MKAKLTILVFVITLFSAITIKAQDFNLFNPSNELYLFSAYDEGSNAFRYNPAVLGLGHRLNMNVSGLMHLGSFQGLNELDLSINAGFLGLGYRRYTDDKIVTSRLEFETPGAPKTYTGIMNLGN